VTGDTAGGVDAGSAYVFTRSGATWTQQAKLTAADGAAGDAFGVSVAVYGDTAVIGASADDDVGLGSGSAYVFVRSGATWTQQTKLTAADGAPGDGFGVSVAVSGDTAMIGALADDDMGTDSGSVYVASRSHAIEVAEDQTLSVTAPGVLANDYDADGDPLSARLVVDVTHGVLHLAADGSFIYAPAADYNGPDSFTYRAFDGIAYSEPVTVAISVTAVWDSIPLEGADRYATAIAASRSAFATGSCDAVVVATGRNYPDALGASGLAGAADCPVLLVNGGLTTLDPNAKAEIDRVTSGRSTRTAYIAGGTGAVSAGIEAALKKAYGKTSVVRLAGADRYATAAAVAAKVKSLNGGSVTGVFVACGTNFPDALAASTLAAALHRPILLTRTGALPIATQLSLASLAPPAAVVCGGVGAVSDAVKAQVNGRVASTVRVSGANRYATAKAIADYGLTQGLKAEVVSLTTGQNFPDALAGGPMTGHLGGVMLLTHTASLDPEPAALLTAHKSSISSVYFLGGTGAISEGVRTAATNILN
jgi:putative cell wall-binding protein